MNDTTRPNGLIPTLLIFGTYLRISKESPPSLSIIECTKIIKKIINKLCKIIIEQKLFNKFIIYNNPNI